MKIRRLILITVLILLLTGCLDTGDGNSDAYPSAELPDTTRTGEETAVDPQTDAIAEPEADTEATADAQIVTAAAQEQYALPPLEILEPPGGPVYTPGVTLQHWVQPGEWLMQIARCYGARYSDVRYANWWLGNPNWIFPGTAVTVPNIGSTGAISGPPCVERYIVQAGDTWSSLAARFNTTAIILQKANPGILPAGRQIYVPNMALPAGPTPATSHDLIFIWNGNLALWRGANGRLAYYPHTQSQILDLATNAGGNLILARQTRDGNASNEIVLIDLTAATVTVIESGLPTDGDNTSAQFRDQLMISPDGQWGVYALPDGDAFRVTTFDTGAPGTLNQISGIDFGGNEFVTPELFPGSDDTHFLWLDGGGIFRLDYGLVAGMIPLYALTDASGANNNPLGIQGFSATAWSPDGRFLLTEGFFIEGGAYFLLYPAGIWFTSVPKSSGYVNAGVAAWEEDGTVVVLSPPEGEDGRIGYAVYQPETAAGDLDLTELTTAMLDGVPVGTGPGYVISAPALQRDPNGVIMAVQTGSGAGNGMYALPNGSTILQQLNEIPGSFGRVTWVPDGTGLLTDIFDQGDVVDTLYTQGDGSPPFSLADWLGFGTSDYNWVTP